MTLILDILIIMVFAFTLGLIGMWQHLSKGAWRNYPTGKALMGLLTAHALIFGLFTLGIFAPGVKAAAAWIVLCVVLLVTKGYVGWVLWSINKQHR